MELANKNPSEKEFKEIFAEGNEYTNKILDEIDSPNPERLYHYTSILGLHAIIESQCLWSTDINFLNDTSEGKHANRIFKENLEKIQINADLKTKIVTQINEHEIKLRVPTDFFIYSFTETKDLLSQWRGYCYQGGVSIGFSSEKFIKYFKDKTLFDDFKELDEGVIPFPSFNQCLYDKNEDTSECNDRKNIDSIVEKIVNLIEKKKEDKFLNVYILCLVNLFNCKVAPHIKHYGFKEEKEWRLVTVVLRQHAKEKINHRVQNNKIIPYIKINAKQLLENIKIVISPNLDYNCTKKGIEKLLDSKGIEIKEDTISKSKLLFSGAK